MPTRKAEAEWKGNLAEGSGQLKVGSGAFDGPYSFKSRFEEGQSATNPEELIGAAHAGCFTMALTAQLSRAGITPTRIHTSALSSRSSCARASGSRGRVGQVLDFRKVFPRAARSDEMPLRGDSRGRRRKAG